MSSLHRWTSLTLALLLAAGCGDSGGDSDTDPGSTGAATTGNPSTTDPGTGSGGSSELGHAADIQPIWDAVCVAACHDDNPMSSGTATTGLILTPASAFDALVNKPSVLCGAQMLVTPGDREASFVWHKINGDQTLVCAAGGSKMPLGKMLTPEDLEKIGTWIDQGALP